MTIRRPFQLPGRKSWYIDIDRKRRSLKTEDLAEALRLYNEYNRLEKLKVQPPSNLTGDKSGLTLQQFAEQYLVWSKENRVQSTFRAERLTFDKPLTSVDGQIRLSDLNGSHLDRLVSELRRAGLTVTSTNHFVRHVKAIFGKAARWGCINENPFRGMPLQRQLRSRLFRLNPSDLPKLLNSIKDPELQALVAAYLSTGRRRGELLNLKWEEIDLEGGRYFVRKPKEHLCRWYPISTAFRSILKARPEPHTGYLFRWRSVDTVTHLVKDALKQAGFPNLHLHHLRHTFGALYVEAGGDLRTLMELLGHRQISTTVIYGSLTKQHLEKEVERVRLPHSSGTAPRLSSTKGEVSQEAGLRTGETHPKTDGVERLSVEALPIASGEATLSTECISKQDIGPAKTISPSLRRIRRLAGSKGGKTMTPRRLEQARISAARAREALKLKREQSIHHGASRPDDPQSAPLGPTSSIPSSRTA